MTAKKRNTTEDSHRVWVLNQLLVVHRDYPAQSLRAARAIVAEGSKFIAEYHGPEIAVGQLDVISHALMGDMRLPPIPEQLLLKHVPDLPAKWWHPVFLLVFFAGWCAGWTCFGLFLLAGHVAALW